MSSNVGISSVITQTSDIQSSNVSTITFDSISTTTTSITTTSITTTTTTTINTPITTTTTNNSFFTDINSTVSTSNGSKNIHTILSGNVPSVTTLTPEESINESDNNIVIFWSLFGSILFSVFLCMFIIYFILRKKEKEKKKENIVIYNPRGVNGLLNGSSYNGIQQTRLNVQPRSDSLKQFNSQYNNSSRYSGDIVELVEITNCNNETNINNNNLNKYQMQKNNEIQNMYNNTVQTNLYENNTNEEIKFAETMNREYLGNNNKPGVTRSLNI